MWDEEKLKRIGSWLVRIAMACVLIYFVWNIIVTQHYYFS